MGEDCGCGYAAEKERRHRIVDRLFVKLAAGITIALFSFAVSNLQRMADDLEQVKLTLERSLSRLSDHDRRIESLEQRQSRLWDEARNP